MRQGDPLSPFLLNFAAECLAKLIQNAQKINILTSLAPDLVDTWVAILQYVDDTMLCIGHDPERAVNLENILYTSELMPGLKINY